MTILPPATRAGMPTWARAVLWTFAGLTVATVAAVLWFVSVLSGGLDDLVTSRPEQGDAEVVQARDAAAPLLDATTADVSRALPLPTTGLRAAADDCETGQHNWKVDDSWDLDCSLVRTDLLVADRADLLAMATSADAELVAAGWTSVTGLPELLERSGPGPAAVYVRGGSALERSAGTTTLSLRLAVRPASGGFSSYDVGLGGYRSTVTREGRGVDATLAAAALEERSVLVVTTSTRYYYA